MCGVSTNVAIPNTTFDAVNRGYQVVIPRDAIAGLNTAGFISGYRGSPLGGYDQALMAAKKHLAKQHIVFQPGVNEELAATADVVARTLAQPLGAALGQNVVVEKRAGGGTVIATEFVAKAPADGHTLLLTGFSFTANSALRRSSSPPAAEALVRRGRSLLAAGIVRVEG